MGPGTVKFARFGLRAATLGKVTMSHGKCTFLGDVVPILGTESCIKHKYYKFTTFICTLPKLLMRFAEPSTSRESEGTPRHSHPPQETKASSPVPPMRKDQYVVGGQGVKPSHL